MLPFAIEYHDVTDCNVYRYGIETGLGVCHSVIDWLRVKKWLIDWKTKNNKAARQQNKQLAIEIEEK